MSIATPERRHFVTTLPDHTQLPDSDGSIVHNFQELPQSTLLKGAIEPVLMRIHPEADYCIGTDCGIYWMLTNPPLRGAIAPDWFYVPHVPPTLDGQLRRSYVLWQERIPPLIVLEYVSGDGLVERDRTPDTGKFWIYEQRIACKYYGIYEVDPGRIEMYHLVDGRFVLQHPNPHGRYPVPEMQAELGIWRGKYSNAELPWMRFWDARGVLLPSTEERAEQERQRADEAQARAERLIAQLRALGIDPDS